MMIPISIPFQSDELSGMLHIPEKINYQRPIIVICNGLNGNRVDNNRILYSFAKKAEKANFIVLRVDFRGLGLSSSYFSKVTIETKCQDIVESIHFLDKCLENKVKKVLLIGFSDGAKVVSKVIHQLNYEISICMWNPVLFECSLNDISDDVLKSDKKKNFSRCKDTGEIAYRLPYTGLLMNIRYLKETQENTNDLAKLINGIKFGLFIYGSEDNKSAKTKKMFDELEEAMCMNVETSIVLGADHLFNNKLWIDEVIEITLKFAEKV